MTEAPEGSPKKTNTFCGFSMGSYHYWAGMVYDLCVYFMTGKSEGSTDSGFIEKHRTCDPWFTRHMLIPYTTAASLKEVFLRDDTNSII